MILRQVLRSVLHEWGRWERPRPERGAGGKRGEAAPPSESERGWGHASIRKRRAGRAGRTGGAWRSHAAERERAWMGGRRSFSRGRESRREAEGQRRPSKRAAYGPRSFSR